MKLTKSIILKVILLTFPYFIYSSIISPKIQINNYSDKVIKITKGEFQDTMAEPDLNEVEAMLANIVSIQPKSNYTFLISLKTLFSKKDIRLDVS